MAMQAILELAWWDYNNTPSTEEVGQLFGGNGAGTKESWGAGRWAVVGWGRMRAQGSWEQGDIYRPLSYHKACNSQDLTLGPLRWHSFQASLVHSVPVFVFPFVKCEGLLIRRACSASLLMDFSHGKDFLKKQFHFFSTIMQDSCCFWSVWVWSGWTGACFATCVCMAH